MSGGSRSYKLVSAEHLQQVVDALWREKDAGGLSPQSVTIPKLLQREELAMPSEVAHLIHRLTALGILLKREHLARRVRFMPPSVAAAIALQSESVLLSEIAAQSAEIAELRDANTALKDENKILNAQLHERRRRRKKQTPNVAPE